MTDAERVDGVAPPGERGERASHGGTDGAADPRLTFTLAGVREGYLAGVPVAAGVAGYGVAFGMLAARAGLSVAEAALMSATVLAGAAQLVAVELWREPVPQAALVGATLVVNFRYLLMGAALRPWFRALSPAQAYGSAFFLADENWALTIAELRSGGRRGAFLLGSGLAVWSFWVPATVAGAVAGGAVARPARFGLDFALAAVLLAVLADLWDDPGDLLPWTGAAAAAVGGSHLLPSYWYVLLGGAAGAATAVVRDG